jgi:hypothetical protein
VIEKVGFLFLRDTKSEMKTYLSVIIASQLSMSFANQTFSALRFEPLQNAYKHLVEKKNIYRADDYDEEADPAQAAQIEDIRESVKEVLDKREWLLEPDQKIDLPSSDLDLSKNLFSLSDFVVRTDEAVRKDLRAAAVGEDGQVRRLSTRQKDELRRTGKVSVPSFYIKNQTHVWKVAPWFYAGRHTIRDSFLDGVGAGLDHIAVYTWSDTEKTQSFPSWPRAIRRGLIDPAKKLLRAVPQFLSAPIRPLKYDEGTIEQFVAAAEYGYVRYHLEEQGYNTSRLGAQDHGVFLQSSQDIWDELEATWESARQYRPPDAYIRRIRDAEELVQMEREQFQKNLDRSMYSPDFDDKKAIESPIHARREERRALEALEKKTAQDLIHHYKNLPGDVFQTEVRRLQVKEIEFDIKQADDKEIQELVQARKAEYKTTRPILSLSKAWLDHAISRYSSNTKDALSASREERLLDKLRERSNFESEVAELRLRQSFRDEVKPHLESVLVSTRKSLTRVFHILVLDPRRWTINYNSREVDRYEKVEVSLDKWGWRFRLIGCTFLQAFRDLSASAYHFLINGPLSMRALISPRAFFSLKRPNHSGGMEDDPESLTPTLASRLVSFFESLRLAREHFEAQPDTGLLDKSIQRFFMKVKLTVTALVGSVLIISFMVLGTATFSALTGVIVIASPILAAIWTALATEFELVFYDFSVQSSAPVWKVVSSVFDIVWHGVLQGALATGRHAIIHPLLGLLHFGWAGTRALLRFSRDCLTGCILFRDAKTPMDDSFIAKRIHGPGMASQTFYRLPLSAAKLSVDIALHEALVHSHVQLRQAELRQPFQRYDRFLNTLTSPFGLKAWIFDESHESIASRLSADVQKRLQSIFPRAISTSGIGFGGPLDHVGRNVRLAHPDVQATIASSMRRPSDSTTRIPSIQKYDSNVLKNLRNTTVKFDPCIPYHLMTIRTGHHLAELELRVRFRGMFVLFDYSGLA